MENRYAAVLILAFSMLLPSFASAAPNTYLTEIGCRIDFNVAVLNSMIGASAGNSSSLQSSVTALTNDKAQLQALQNSTNTSSFSLQYASDMKQARNAVAQWRADVLKGLTLGEKAALVSSYRFALSSYEQCSFSAEQAMAQDRITNYQQQIAKFQNISSMLGSRGFDASQMNQVLQDAQSQLISPLQSAISAANDSQSLGLALKTYCLYDGCTNGTNFHLEAKFDIAKYSTVLAALQNVSSAFNLSSATLAQAAQNLGDASSTLAQVGTAAYAKNQGQTLFNDIKAAAQEISQLLGQIEREAAGGLK